VNVLTKLAAFVQSRDLEDLPPARFDRLKLHIVDASGARLAGSRTDEGAAIARLAGSMIDGLTRAVLAGCAQTRCTEIDDIHLTSCTTPGSVVVPTALALARDGELRSVGEVCAAALAGFEALIRFGVAIDGPTAIRQGVWPTHAAAAFGSAAVACRAYGLSVDRTAGALATALAFGSGAPVSAALPASSRWMTLGLAAANGVTAAHAAREGLLATADHAALGPGLTKGIGRRFLFDGIGTKPYPTARQGLAAIEAARELADAERLVPSGIDAVVVHLPEPQRAIVDHPAPPASRFASIVSVQYQIALALIAPERLLDVRRTPPFADDRVRALMTRIRVRRARDLEKRYPRAWPARVEIRANGRRHRRLLLHPRGDARNPFGWDDMLRKFLALAGPAIGEASAARVVGEMQGAVATADMPALWELR
jgi:2-methylcitrate dehydratase PrpD